MAKKTKTKKSKSKTTKRVHRIGLLSSFFLHQLALPNYLLTHSKIIINFKNFHSSFSFLNTYNSIVILLEL